MDQDVLTSLMKRFPMKRTASGLIRTCPGRLTFGHLVVPQENENGGKAKYNAGLMFPKGADIKLLVEATQAELVREHGPDSLKLVPSKIDWPVKDQGEMTMKDGELWAGMEAGAKYIDARTTIKPACVDLRGVTIDPAKLYNGCWVIATVSPYANTWNDPKGKLSKRYVTISLNNILFLADDDAFGGGGTKPEEDFGDMFDASANAGAAFTGGGKSNGAASKDDAPFDFNG